MHNTNAVEALLSGHTRDVKKVSVPEEELAAYGNVTIQSLYGS